jgi:hypothetical protein
MEKNTPLFSNVIYLYGTKKAFVLPGSVLATARSSFPNHDHVVTP